MPQGGKRVLVAEDEFLVRLLVVDDLRACGFEVLEAGDGLDAIAMLDSSDQFDAIVTNVTMPGTSGVALAIAARARHPELPVIFISATPQRIQAADGLKPYHCLSKPFDTSDLVRLVQRLTASKSGDLVS